MGIYNTRHTQTRPQSSRILSKELHEEFTNAINCAYDFFDGNHAKQAHNSKVVNVEYLANTKIFQNATARNVIPLDSTQPNNTKQQLNLFSTPHGTQPPRIAQHVTSHDNTKQQLALFTTKQKQQT